VIAAHRAGVMRLLAPDAPSNRTIIGQADQLSTKPLSALEVRDMFGRAGEIRPIRFRQSGSTRRKVRTSTTVPRRLA
jgi:hypothetical protein